MSSNYVEIVNKRKPDTVGVQADETQSVQLLPPRIGQLGRDRVVIIVGDGSNPLPPAVNNAVSRIVETAPGQPVIEDLRQTTAPSRDPNIVQAEKVIYVLNAISDFRRPTEQGVLNSDELVARALMTMGYKRIKINHMFEEIFDSSINDSKIETISGGSLEQALQQVDINRGLIEEFSDSPDVYIRSTGVVDGQVTSNGTIHFKLG